MRKERLLFLKIAFTVGIMVALPVIVTLTNLSSKNQDIRSKATSTTPTPDKIIYLPFSFSKDNDDDDLFEFEGKPQIRNGFIPQNKVLSGPQYTAKILDYKGTIITTQRFTLPQVVAIDKFDQRLRKEEAELKKVTADNHGLTLPYRADASFVQIVNNKGEVVKTISLVNASSFNNILDLKEIHGDTMKDNRNMLNQINILPKTQVLAANGTFNITIIGDNYNGDNLHFQNDVNDIASGLLSIEPFKSYKTNIVFYPQLSTFPICTYTNSTLSCNDTLSLQEASGTPYDKIYVLYNGPYGGYAYLGATLAYGTNATNMATTVKQGLFIHELAGHTLGGLMDEYSYGTTGASYAPNCSDSPSCPSWNTITGLGCFSSCGFTNLYRATNNTSVMNTALLNGTINFDAFSTQIVAGKLVSYFNVNPPTATIPPPQPTPTITLPPPTPTNTPTPTVFATPSPTSSVLPPLRNAAASFETTISATPTPSPTPTPTPSLTITPTPTQPMGCNFPNFCTREKFCASENTLTINCTGSALVCCQGQTPSSANVTPTITQKFSLLPTMAMIPQDKSGRTAIPTSTPTLTSTPTPSPISILISVIITPTVSTLTPTLQPPQKQKEGTISIQEISSSPIVKSYYEPTNTPIMVARPTLTPQESFPIYPTATPYKIEEIDFERPTPTSPPPKVELVDILAAPSRFINNLVVNFFSLFRRN